MKKNWKERKKGIRKDRNRGMKGNDKRKGKERKEARVRRDEEGRFHRMFSNIKKQTKTNNRTINIYCTI